MPCGSRWTLYPAPPAVARKKQQDKLNNGSNLQIMPLIKGCFWPKKRVIAEKPGSHGNYFALFSRFSAFSGFFSVASHCLPTTSGNPIPPKKIIPKILP
jgi:hypothetical protein